MRSASRAPELADNWRRQPPRLPDKARRASGLLTALLLAGCGTIAAYQSDLATWQALADRATARVGQPRVIVKPTSGATGRYDCQDNRVLFGTEGNARWLLAHELGHYVMHHCEPQPWAVALEDGEPLRGGDPATLGGD
jgi:hypothetical protein